MIISVIESERCFRLNVGKGKREHSRKPDELYDIIEACSPGPYLELFARFGRPGWKQWGNEDVEENSLNGVAMRKGHVNCEFRLLEPPKGYRASGAN